MLKKLIKYDMRETYKVTVWLSALELLLFLICFAVIQWLKKRGTFLLEEDVNTALSLIFTIGTGWWPYQQAIRDKKNGE